MLLSNHMMINFFVKRNIEFYFDCYSASLDFSTENKMSDLQNKVSDTVQNSLYLPNVLGDIIIELLGDHSNFSGSDLSGIANLSRANLSGTNLSGADLRGCSSIDADLENAQS